MDEWSVQNVIGVAIMLAALCVTLGRYAKKDEDVFWIGCLLFLYAGGYWMTGL